MPHENGRLIAALKGPLYMEQCLCLSANEDPKPVSDCWICAGTGVIASPLHKRLIESRSLLHIATTGAGPRLLQTIWDNTGISEYFNGAEMPYKTTQTRAVLGHAPDQGYVAEDVAYDLAMASYLRAAETKVVEALAGDPIGLGISAAVASNRWPHGGHRAHMVLITKDRVVYRLVNLVKGTGKEVRQYHDQEIASAMVGLLLAALTGELPAEPACEERALERFHLYPVFGTDGTRRKHSAGGRRLYLPATLNPIHEGHRFMCRAAEESQTEDGIGPVRAIYLVSSVSPHKGRLSVQQMLMTAGMLRAERWREEYEPRMVEFTHDEPLFIDKARKREGSTFIIGADTMQRMLDPQWGPAIEEMLTEMSNLRVKFLVMGRLIADKWVTCRDVKVSWPHQLLFEPLEGRLDISSTQIRTQQNAQTAA
jgi:nicotinic acid mononucleotide adenylyltransferase